MHRVTAGGGEPGQCRRRLVGALLLAAFVLGVLSGAGPGPCFLDGEPHSAPASSPSTAADAEGPCHDDADDCCSPGCMDCAYPCCQSSISAFLLPGQIFAADMKAEPAALPPLVRHVSCGSSGLDRPPRA